MVERTSGIHAVHYRKSKPMNDEPRKTKPNWSSVASLIIFVLFVAGQPLANLVRRLVNGSFSFPSLGTIAFPWQGLLPLAIAVAALVVGAVVIARVLRVGDSAMRPPAMPVPSQRYDATMPQSPRFEPLFHSRLLLFGIVGFVLFAAAGFVIVQFGI